MGSTEVAGVRIALVTDTYTPQVNGVTTVVQRIARLLRAAGHAAAVVAPRYPDRAAGNRNDELRVPSLPFPPYPSVRLSLPFGHRVDPYLVRFAPDLVHVHTEGPLGTIGRRWALRRRRTAGHDISHALPTVRPLLRSTGAGGPGLALADLVS